MKNQFFENEHVKRWEEGKTISVRDLPNSKHKRQLMKIVINPSEAKVILLARRNISGNTWSACVGYPSKDDLNLKKIEPDKLFDILWACEHIHTSEDVWMLGEELDGKDALRLFPEWNDLKYRRITR